jgi:hypothetical protein
MHVPCQYASCIREIQLHGCTLHAYRAPVHLHRKSQGNMSYGSADFRSDTQRDLHPQPVTSRHSRPGISRASDAASTPRADAPHHGHEDGTRLGLKGDTVSVSLVRDVTAPSSRSPSEPAISRAESRDTPSLTDEVGGFSAPRSSWRTSVGDVEGGSTVRRSVSERLEILAREAYGAGYTPII